MSELLPHTGSVADELCVIRSLHTDAINHDPAITFLQTGSQIAGRPSIGAWLSYGLGSESADLPAFVALSSRGAAKADQPLYDRLWGSGFLPTKYQGVKFRNQGDPVLDLTDPAGRRSRRPGGCGSTTWPSSTAEARADGRSGDSDAHRPVRAGVSHADVGAGADRLRQ